MRAGLTRTLGDPSSKEPKSGLRDHAGTIPQMARCSAATVVKIGAHEVFAAIGSSHATWPVYLGYKQAESPVLYGSTLYVLGLFCKDVNLGTGDIFESNEHASTNGGSDDRDGRDRQASGLTAASKAPRSMENLGRRVDPHRREKGSLHSRRGHNGEGFRLDGRNSGTGRRERIRDEQGMTTF